MTFQHWAGVTAYTSPCGLARCCVFVKQSLPPALCHPFELKDAKSYHLKGSSFFRSYGGILPSSLTIVLPIALVFSTRPPESVWGTGAVSTRCWAFLDSVGSMTTLKRDRHRVSELMSPTLIGNLLLAYPGTTIAPDHLPSCVPLQLPANKSVGSPEGSPHFFVLGLDVYTAVLEYQPVVHRIRLSASP